MTTTEAYRIPNSAEKATGLLQGRSLLGSDTLPLRSRAALAQYHLAGGTAGFIKRAGNHADPPVGQVQIFQDFGILGALGDEVKRIADGTERIIYSVVKPGKPLQLTPQPGLPRFIMQINRVSKTNSEQLSYR